MFWTILALLFLVVLGGFVSYYGDLQGRRWGKKRVSLFGLRPKHTAILITTLTGSAIVFLSAAAIMLAAPNVRDVVLRGEHAIRENNRLISEKQKAVAETERVIRQNSAQVKQTKDELAATSSELAKEKLELSTLKQQYQVLTTQNAALQQQNATLTATINKQQKIHAILIRENSKLNKDKRELAVWNKNAEQINKDLAERNIVLSGQNFDLTKTNTDLQQEKAVLLKNNAELTKQNAQVRAENDAIFEESKNRNLEVMKLKQDIAGLTQQRADMMEWIKQREELYGQITGANQNILQNFAMLRRGYLNIRADSELARLTISPHLRPEAVRIQLVQLLMNASETARKLGATPDMGGREVRVVPKQVLTLTGTQKIDENASLDALADNLSGRDNPVVVIANAISNNVKGEVVFVELRPYNIEHIYDRGAKVAERRIDARQPVDKIIETLIQFLQKDVREAATTAGLLPRMDPETGLPEIGIIGTADLFQLTDRVRKMGGEVQLTATAKHEVSSAGPLNLEFKVSRMSDKSDGSAEKR